MQDAIEERPKFVIGMKNQYMHTLAHEFGIGRDRSGALGTLPQSTVAGRTRSAPPAEVFTVGKLLGDDLTVSYQQGLAETEGSLRVAWRCCSS